jgi:hypothetical protein
LNICPECDAFLNEEEHGRKCPYYEEEVAVDNVEEAKKLTFEEVLEAWDGDEYNLFLEELDDYVMHIDLDRSSQEELMCRMEKGEWYQVEPHELTLEPATVTAEKGR